MMQRRTVVTLLVIASVVGAFESYFLARKFPLYEPNAYNRRPIAAIGRVGRIRVGILLGHHGASFIRVPPETRPHGTIPPDVVSDMRHELALIPVKVAVEAGLYFAALSLAWFGTIAASKRSRPVWQAIAVGGVVTSSLLLVQLPVLWGYDSTGFSNWVGPGALSYSYSGAGITWIPGVSIAQRFVVEALHTGVFRLLAAPSRWLSYIDITVPSPESWPVACVVAALFYGVLVSMLSFPVLAIRRWRNASS